MFFGFFEGIQFLAFLANSYKNLENGKTKYLFHVFAKYFWSEIFWKKVSKKKFHTGTVCLDYVNDRYTMRYSLSFPLKKSSLNLVKLISSQILKFQNKRY